MAVLTLLESDSSTDEKPTPVERPDFKQRLRFLLDAKNTEWPLEIDGPNGERYLSAHVVRAVTLAAQASMGWCDPGVNTALTLMRQPKLRRDENTGILRSFSAKTEISDKYAGQKTLTRDRIVRALDFGLSRFTRGATPWRYELGDAREVNRKTLYIEDNVEHVISEETLRFLPLDVHGWFQASSYTDDLTDRDYDTIRYRVQQFINYDITLTMTGATPADRVHDIVSPPVPQEQQVDIFNDQELLNELVTVALHGDVHQIRGH